MGTKLKLTRMMSSMGIVVNYHQFLTNICAELTIELQWKGKLNVHITIRRIRKYEVKPTHVSLSNDMIYFQNKIINL